MTTLQIIFITDVPQSCHFQQASRKDEVWTNPELSGFHLKWLFLHVRFTVLFLLNLQHILNLLVSFSKPEPREYNTEEQLQSICARNITMLLSDTQLAAQKPHEVSKKHSKNVQDYQQCKAIHTRHGYLVLSVVSD